MRLAYTIETSVYNAVQHHNKSYKLVVIQHIQTSAAEALLLNLPPVCRLIIVSDEAHNHCVFYKCGHFLKDLNGAQFCTIIFNVVTLTLFD